MKIGILSACLLFLVGTANAQSGQKTISDYYNAVKSEPDPIKMEELLAEMEKHGGDPYSLQLIEYSKQITAIALAEAGNVRKAGEVISRIKDDAMKQVIVASAINTWIGAGKLQDAEKWLMPAWEDVKKNGRKPASVNSPFNTEGPSEDDFKYLYGKLLYKKQEYKKAVEYLTPPEGVAGRGRRSFDGEMYALALAKSGDNEEAFEQMNKLMKSSTHFGNEFNTTARKVFINKFGNDSRFRELQDSVANMARVKMSEKIAKMKTEQPAPDFKVVDLNGKEVSLSSLRGKTVILDFWATWCQPCVASFPGMQKAVNFYRKDTSIVFMFIHTLEKNDHAVADVKKFMSFKKYKFDVYMDLKNPESHKNEAVSAYGVRGIPAKFIIDKSGVIRYKNAGYISEEEAIPEIRAMLESIN